MGASVALLLDVSRDRQSSTCLIIAMFSALVGRIEKGVVMPFTYKLAYAAMLGILLSACATRPREFDARLYPAPADTNAYLRDYATCRLFVNSKFRSNSGQKAATLAVGYATVIGGPILAAGIRSSREKRWKGEMASCLDQYGHKVCQWQPLKKSSADANRPAVKSRKAKSDPCALATEQPS